MGQQWYGVDMWSNVIGYGLVVLFFGGAAVKLVDLIRGGRS